MTVLFPPARVAEFALKLGKLLTAFEVTSMSDVAKFPVMTIHEAASRLDVSVEQMLAWNMVVIHQINGLDVVPCWSVDPLIARYLPTLSQVFQGEALTYCLANIRPFGDARDGMAALRSGNWREVLEELQTLREKFDHAMAQTREVDMASYMPVAKTPAIARLH